jgi:hypothetical protein
MTAARTVLLIGEEPGLVDYSDPAIPPGMNPDVVWEGVTEAQKRFEDLGYRTDLCMTDEGETAEAVIAGKLAQSRYDCIVIGAGLRLPPAHLLLFEKVVNAVHRHAPGTPIAFNTRPDDSPEAALRWLEPDRFLMGPQTTQTAQTSLRT